MSGYQLHRLKTELEQALIDLSARPSTFKVLVGWSGTKPSRESELWNEVNKDEAKATIEQFLELIDEAQRKGLSLWAIGD